MGYRLKAIAQYQLQALNRNTAHYYEFLEVSEYLGEWMLWGLEHLPTRASGDDEGDWLSTTKTLLARLFNDFEVVKICALRGFPDQAYAPLRDTIECTMLIRLFMADPKLARRWLTEANEYTPGTVYARLSELKIPAPEYAFYGLLSDRSHANVIGSIANVNETEIDRGVINVTWGVGGSDNPTFTRLVLLQTCSFQLFALMDPLTVLFKPHLGADWGEWRRALNEGVRRLAPLVPDASHKEPASTEVVKVAVGKIDKKFERTTQKLLAEMQKLLGDDFHFQ